MKNICAFCEKDLNKEKFREDYVLCAWRDDPKDLQSLNKEARCVHPKCLKRFLEMNWDSIREIYNEI